MSLRYTNKLFYNYIRYTNCKYNAFSYIHKNPIFANQLRNIRKKSVLYYSTVSADSPNIVTLPQYIKDGNTLNHQQIDRILSFEKIADLSQEQKALLLQCCGKLLSNKSLDFRIQLCNKVFQKFDSVNCLSTDDYNVYIKVCTENEVNIDNNTFLKSMKCEPNEEIFKLLLENVCERGDTGQAYDLLSKMKDRNYAADERVFNALVLAHAITDGLQGAKGVLKTMRAAHIDESLHTNWNILIGLAGRDNNDEFMEALENTALTFNKDYFMKLIMKIGLNDNQELIEELKRKFEIKTLPRRLHRLLEHLCIHLIHRRKAENAVRIYCTFTEQNIEEECGKFLLEEILEIKMDPNDIIKICKYLSEIGRNSLALQHVTDVALRKQKTEEAWFFLQYFDKLRPHYFWPLLVSAATEEGEIGILNAVKKMLDLKVEMDSETLETYILLFCDISSPKSFFLRIQHLNLPLRYLFTPMLVLLLKSGRIKDANQLCHDYNVALDGSKLTYALALGWEKNKDVNCILKILQQICKANETEADFAGIVIANMLRLCKTNEDFNEFLKFIKVLHKEKLLIKSSSGETIQYILRKKETCNIKAKIEEVLDNLLDVSVIEGKILIAHPRDMTLEELECHLTQLTNKNMETRGVLRHLILAHGRLGHYSRVQELRNLFKESGYEESAGMIAVLFQTYIKTKQSQMAMEIYKELQTKHPHFNIDEYKLIDLAALLVDEDKFEIAIKLLNEGYENRVVRGGPSIERNCTNLLNAAKAPDQVLALFEFLIGRGFCKPKNVFFGNIVRCYIKCNDLENAVNYYEDCCKKHKCTPLQIELLQTLIDAKNESLLKRVLESTATVYGPVKTHVSLAVALADKGMKKPLTKLLTDMRHVPNADLQNRCDKWVNEGKLESLLILAEAASRLQPTVINLNIIHLAIVQIFASKNDCKGALNFINNLKEEDIIVSQKVIDVVNKLVNRNKTSVDDRLNLRNFS